MRQYKRKLERFSFYDRTGMQRHLEEMAAKGWVLERMGNLWWVYRRQEPEKVHVTVSYHSKGSRYDPEMGQEQEEKVELCQHSGWKLVAANAQIQVFYNWEEDPIPMETDPETEVAAMHRVAKRTYLPLWGTWLAIALLYLGIFTTQWLRNPVKTLADTSILLRGILGVLILLWACVEVVGYLRWYGKAKKLARQGRFLDTSGAGVVGKAVLGTALAALALYWLEMLMQNNPVMQAEAAAYAIILLALCGFIPQITRILRQHRVPKQTNAMVSAGLTLLVSTLVLVGMAALVAGQRWDISDTGSGMEEYVHQPPLTIDQLEPVDAQRYTTMVWREESALVGRYERMELEEWELMENQAGAPEMTYTLVQIHVPALYNLCRDSYLNREYRMTQSEPWLAQEAYQYTSENRTRPQYLLCYPGRLVLISLSWEPTQEQMAVVGEKLGGM